MTDAKAMQATPALTLEEHIMSSRHAKNEAEWWASREIESLRQQLAECQAQTPFTEGPWEEQAYNAGKKEGQREALLEAAEWFADIESDLDTGRDIAAAQALRRMADELK